MAVEVIMPKVDMVMETGTFVEWLKTEGAYVEKGEPLFVITTDKAAMEIEAPASGYLTSLRAKPSDEIPVTTVIAYISESKDSPEQILPAAPNGDQAEKKPAQSTPVAPAQILPQAPALALEYTNKVRATPIARKLAAELGINLKNVAGRGPKGRIHKADVQMVAQNASQTTGQAPFAPGPLVGALPFSPPEIAIPLPDARQKQVLPLVGPRRIIAQRMHYSASVAPHISLTLSVDMSEASAWRLKVSSQIEEETGHRVTFTAILAKAVVFALTRHPFLNASLVEDQIILWEDIHLGIATNIDDYLIVPVIRSAQEMSLPALTASLGDLLARARSKKLTPAEMSGSTFTISNLGMFGIETFTAIINPPEAGILAAGKIEERQVMTPNGPAFRPMMSLTINTDHRIVDGVAAARFLAECKKILENPYLLI